jgi:transposase
MLQPVVRRSWAPRGKTPIQQQWDRHDRLSVIRVITISPRRCRLGLYWEMHRHNLRGAQVVAFLRRVRRHLRRKLVLVLDRWSVHRSAVTRRFLARHGATMEVEWLPRYAPDLNPVEQVWNHAKYADLPNVAPADLEELDARVRYSMGRTRGQQQLLRSFLRMAKLRL